MQYAITEEKLELEHSWHSKTVGTNVGDIGNVGDVDDVGDALDKCHAPITCTARFARRPRPKSRPS